MYKVRSWSTRLALALTFVAAPTVIHGQAAKVDLTGKWTFSVVTENGTGTPSVTFKQQGDSLTGHYSSQVFGEVDFKGTVKDSKFTFYMSPSVQGQSINLTYTGTIESADAVKGTVDLGGFGGGTFTGTRQKP